MSENGEIYTAGKDFTLPPAIVPPEEACQVVWEKAEGGGVKVKMVGLRIIICQLTGKVISEVEIRIT